jgi:hypothetical protein
METGAAPVEVLGAWAAQTEKELEELQLALRPLEEQLAAKKERLDLIRRLIGMAGARDSGSEVGEGTVRAPGRSDGLAPGALLEDHIELILAENAEPMHIGDLREALISRGVPLPGRGDQANIIVRLRRDETRFQRTGRGMYGLASWGIPSVQPTRKVRVRRRGKPG